jgi:S-adenosylmethionine decarboxylase
MNKPVPMHSVKPNPFGAHIRMMTDITMIRALLYRLPEDMGMHRIREPVIVSVGPNCHKDPGGLSGFVMIAESHISFHTFPARGFVTMDLYTSQKAIGRNATVAYLKVRIRTNGCGRLYTRSRDPVSRVGSSSRK